MTPDEFEPINVLMTSVGNDGFPTVVQALKSNSERNVRIIGCDVRPNAPGLYLADQGYLVPSRGSPKELIQRLTEICQKEDVSILYPLSTEDQDFFASRAQEFEQAGILVLTSASESLCIANDKPSLYKFAAALGFSVPQYTVVRDWGELEKAAHELGYPDYPFVLKMNRGTGAQGVKVIYPSVEGQRRLMDRDNRVVAFHELENWLKSIDPWPLLHLTEYLPGSEYSVDILCDHGRVLSSVTRLRLAAFYGLALHAETVDEKDVEAMACGIVGRLGLSYVVNVQVRRDRKGVAKLMEVNPRIPGTIGLTIAAGINMPYLAIKLALKEPFVAPKPRIGITVLRYWGTLYVNNSQVLK
jgi:carbamoyl-phosphate synthase large subunit